jgi:hypothetical protein
VRPSIPTVIETTARLAWLYKLCNSTLTDLPDFEDRWDEWRDGVGSDIERSLARIVAALLLWYAERAGAVDLARLPDEDLKLYLGELARDPSVRMPYLRAALFATASVLAFEAARSRGDRFAWPAAFERAPELAAIAHLSLMWLGPANGLGGDVGGGGYLVADLRPTLAV